MSDIVISVVSVDKTTPQGKKYSVLEVMYKNQSFQNKAEEKKLNSYYDKPVFEILQDANKGDVFTISRQKDDNGFWKWVGITAGEGAAGKSTGSAASSTAAPTSTSGRSYVADDVKQDMIIRQSSLASAVNFCKDKEDFTHKEVIDVAQMFVEFVYNKKPDVAAKPTKAALPAELDDDLDDLPV